MAAVNERTSQFLDVAFTDENGVAAVPATVSFTIADVASGTEIRTGTITPASTVTLELTPDDMAILTDSNTSEIRRITFTATYAAGRESNSERLIKVTNLADVP